MGAALYEHIDATERGDINLRCGDCGYMMADHSFCSVCDAALHDKSSTALEFAHGVCRKHLEHEEQQLINLLRECSRTLTVLHTSGALDPTQQGIVSPLVAKLSEAGIDGQQILWDAAHTFEAVPR